MTVFATAIRTASVGDRAVLLKCKGRESSRSVVRVIFGSFSRLKEHCTHGTKTTASTFFPLALKDRDLVEVSDKTTTGQGRPSEAHGRKVS
jgi:hypothetical protein